MKKKLKILIPIVLIGIIIVLLYKIFFQIKYKNELQNKIKEIPEFSTKTIDGVAFTNKNIKPNTLSIFIYYNSECEHCQNQALQIQKNIEKFGDCQLVFISSEILSKIIEFRSKNIFNGVENIYFLQDINNSFANTLGVNHIPTIILYDKDHKIIEKVQGELRIEAILKKLKHAN